MLNIFEKKINSKYDNEENVFPFDPKFSEYLLDSFNIFVEIINTDINYDYFSLINFVSKTEQSKNYAAILKFVTSIKLRGLRKGNCVNRYLDNIDKIPSIINLIVKQKNNKYILINDSESIEYKMVLFSMFTFINSTNYKIFQLKIHKWYETNKSKENTNL